MVSLSFVSLFLLLTSCLSAKFCCFALNCLQLKFSFVKDLLFDSYVNRYICIMADFRIPAIAAGSTVDQRRRLKASNDRAGDGRRPPWGAQYRVRSRHGSGDVDSTVHHRRSVDDRCDLLCQHSVSYSLS